MKAILVSHRFNPGHLSHIQANYQLLIDKEYSCYYRVNRLFSKILGNIDKLQTVSLRNCLYLTKNDIFIIWFPSIYAAYDACFIKIFTHAKIVYIYHEPYTSFQSYRESGFSFLKTLKVTAISIISKIICGFSEKIILPSQNAFDAYPSAKNNSNRFAKINLMFSDEADANINTSNRKSFSYIGTIAEDHAFDKFVEFVQIAIERGSLKEYEFTIATKSKIPTHLNEVINYCVSTGRMHVQSGRPLSNEEINAYYANSKIIWNAYRRSMQSGVLPKAYMFGTPVIISESNQSEYFKDNYTGVMISSSYQFDEICQSIENISKNWEQYSENCRTFFLETFHYKALTKQFIDFVTEEGTS